ncbi:MAG: ThiF family adenylyltransferase [Acidobacteriaceae bacterium]|nr:ThiF family adenylyltransferase [Acidobacteriaceae bacterium]
MPNPSINPDAVKENALSLAAALGIELERAAELLNAHVMVTHDTGDPSAVFIAAEARALLARTLQHVDDVASKAVCVELVIGDALPQSTGTILWLSIESGMAVIARERRTGATETRLHPAVLFVAACYATAAVVREVIGDGMPLPRRERIVLNLEALGISEALAKRTIDLGHAYLAGAGAIGTGFLWCLRWFAVHGILNIVDFDWVKSRNLNRQLWYGPADIMRRKAERLAALAQGSFPELVLKPRVAQLQDLSDKDGDPQWLRRLIVAVDSRAARRTLQSELPGEVFDASTTDIREIIVHTNRQPTPLACMECIYPRNAQEDTRARSIAAALGVTVNDIRRGIIDQAAARLIIGRYPERNLTEESLIGEAYDSLFKSLCAQAALRSADQQQVFAPFAFVSALAGALLAIETVRRVGGEPVSYNYWRVSPWEPFDIRLQRRIPASAECEICANPVIRQVAAQVWESRQ